MNEGLIITADGQRIGNDLDTFQDDQIAEAKSKNYKFIKIELNRAFVRGGQEEIRYTGVYIANSFVDGKDEYNLDNIRTIIQAGSLIFKMDVIKRRWFAEMLDDTEPGVLRGPGERKDVTREYTAYTKDGPVQRKHIDKNVEVKKGKLLGTIGYNRDFLASHWKEGMFIIHDPEVKQDVENRYLMSIGKRALAEIPVTEEQKIKAENEKLKKELAEKNRQMEVITKLKGRPAKRKGRPPKRKQVINDKHTKNDNNVAEGDERLEPAGKQGDSPGTE